MPIHARHYRCFHSCDLIIDNEQCRSHTRLANFRNGHRGQAVTFALTSLRSLSSSSAMGLPLPDNSV
eukprot:1499457-Amphidinium_carterae.1